MPETRENPASEHAFGERDVPEPRYRGRRTSSLYLTMRDGVKIALDLDLPEGLPEGKRIPAILMQTRYWRDMRLKAPFRWFMSSNALVPAKRNVRKFFAERGYALVLVDERGTGASFGVHRVSWQPESVEDAREIVEWILRQPWSNGRIGAFGKSYLGTTAEYLATLRHPAIKVVVPQFNHPDSYLDISLPGGVFNSRFMMTWGELNASLDRNVYWTKSPLLRFLVEGAKPVDGDRGATLRDRAVREHGHDLFPVYDEELYRDAVFRDDREEGSGLSIDDMALHTKGESFFGSMTRIIGWASWLDAGTADAALRRFLSLPNATAAVIGAWEHGGNFSASPYAPPDSAPSPDSFSQFAELLRLLDQYLRDGGEAEPADGKILYYYTMGEEKWKSSPVWPPAGTVTETWYLGEGLELVPGRPPEGEGFDDYMANAHTGSGTYNRWWEMGVYKYKSVSYGDRSEQCRRSLSFRSEPLESDVEISGYPVVHLWLSSDRRDGNFFVYLEDEDEHGYVRYVTEGTFRAIHRRISTEKPSYVMQYPYHSYKRSDAMPLVPGERAELAFGLQPTSTLVKAGHRLRLSIAARDDETFLRVPREGEPALRFYRGGATLSRVELPSIRKGTARGIGVE